MKILTTLVLSALLTIGCSMTGQVQAEDSYFTQAELDSLLAPVALYPDSVLSHVLIAATYPLEVIQAARWSREHPGLRGEDAVAAVEHQNWDPSVKALVAFPELLERMDDDLEWTQNLGDAFLVQEEDVIASIQYLRSEAYSQGHLKSNDRVKVVREKEYIYIEPARTRVVYVPYYDTRVIYKRWRWSSYRPVYWHHPSGFSVGMNFYWGRPYHIRPSFYFSSFHWPTRRVVVVNHHHHYYRDHGFHSGRDVARFREARHWRHDPVHRRGVSYRGRVEKTRFVDSSRPASASVSSRSSRAVVRSERRDWAAERRSSLQFDRKTQPRSRGGTRSERVAELRGSDRSGQSRPESRERGSSRVDSSRMSNRGRGMTGQARERVATHGRSAGSAADDRASRSSGRSKADITSRSGSKRSSVSIPRDLSVRSSNSRQRSSTPSRSTRSSMPSRGASIERSSAPSRESVPSRSRSGSQESASSRSAPRIQSSAPTRDSRSSTSAGGSRSFAPSQSSKSSAPSRSRGASTRSSRGSASSRSRGADSRRGGGDKQR